VTLGALLAGKTAVVTGGANGMGAGIVEAFSAQGVAQGVVLDLPGSLGRRPLPHGWREVPVDLRDDGSVSAAFAEVRSSLDSIGVLAAVAGIVPLWTGIGGLDPAEWDQVFAVNARGVMRSMQEALPSMGVGGSMIVIASQNSWRGNPNLASYTASKHAVLGLVRSVALELGPQGIRVNAIAPGSIATEAYLSRLRRREGEGGLAVEESLARDGQTTALGRIATVEEIANGAVFLASDLAAGIAGHMLPIGPGVR
jgi:NAD(P)-dependent dehydrogenase (short-subunit alcohol dehydrogenase family)